MVASRFLNPKLLLSVIIILIVLAASYLVFGSLKFRLTGTNPSLSKVASITPFLELNFNRDLNTKDVWVTAPGGLIKTVSVSAKTVHLDLYPMTSNHEYSIDIRSISAVDGSTIKNRILRFTAEPVAYNDLPADQKSAILRAQAVYSPTKNDPILTHLPYGTADFKLTARIVGNPPQIYLEASLLLSAADQRSNPDAATRQYKDEVMAYIKSLGLDPGKYQIDYTVIPASLY